MHIIHAYTRIYTPIHTYTHLYNTPKHTYTTQVGCGLVFLLWVSFIFIGLGLEGEGQEGVGIVILDVFQMLSFLTCCCLPIFIYCPCFKSPPDDDQ